MPTSSLFISCIKVGERSKHHQNYIFITIQKINALNEYLKRTKTWRTNRDKFQLLLSYIKFHVEVHSSTDSKRIKEILKETWVDVDVFKGHSTRSASTSKACLSGISVDDILSRGSWSNESTWQKFYHKQVLSKGQRFQEEVLE